MVPKQAAEDNKNKNLNYKFNTPRDYFPWGIFPLDIYFSLLFYMNDSLWIAAISITWFICLPYYFRALILFWKLFFIMNGSFLSSAIVRT